MIALRRTAGASNLEVRQSPRRPRRSYRLTPLAAVVLLLGAGLGAWPAGADAAAAQPRLGTAANYTVMAGSAITNTNPTVITGNLAISPSNASSVTGFPPGIATGAKHYNDAAAILAQTDLVTTYNDAAGATPFTDMSGVDLGGKTLTPGVYHFSSSAQLTGTLTLDGQGSTNATYIFQIGSTLTTASASRVVLLNGAGACAVFWQVTSSATLGTTTAFQGNLVALTSITMNNGATIGVGGGVNGGRALARNGALTLNNNTIVPPPAACAFSPAPSPTAVPSAAPVASATPRAVPVGLPNTAGPGRPPTDPVPWGPIAAAILIGAALIVPRAWRRRRPN